LILKKIIDKFHINNIIEKKFNTQRLIEEDNYNNSQNILTLTNKNDFYFLVKWGGETKYTFEHSSMIIGSEYFKQKLKQYIETKSCDYQSYLRQHYNRNCKLSNELNKRFDFNQINEPHNKLLLMPKDANENRYAVIKKFFDEILNYNVYYIHNSFATNNIYANFLIPLMTKIIPYEKKVINLIIIFTNKT